jgi:hypothetical protein
LWSQRSGIAGVNCITQQQRYQIRKTIQAQVGWPGGATRVSGNTRCMFCSVSAHAWPLCPLVILRCISLPHGLRFVACDDWNSECKGNKVSTVETLVKDCAHAEEIINPEAHGPAGQEGAELHTAVTGTSEMWDDIGVSPMTLAPAGRWKPSTSRSLRTPTTFSQLSDN